jgi:hypothetical protein
MSYKFLVAHCGIFLAAIVDAANLTLDSVLPIGQADVR